MAGFSTTSCLIRDLGSGLRLLIGQGLPVPYPTFRFVASFWPWSCLKGKVQGQDLKRKKQLSFSLYEVTHRRPYRIKRWEKLPAILEGFQSRVLTRTGTRLPASPLPLAPGSQWPALFLLQCLICALLYGPPNAWLSPVHPKVRVAAWLQCSQERQDDFATLTGEFW